MKLIQKTNRNFIFITLISLPLAGVLMFYVFRYSIQNEVDEKLKVDEFRIQLKLRENVNFSSIAPVIEVKKVSNNAKLSVQFQDKYVFDPIEKEKELFRELKTVRAIHGEKYEIVVRNSFLETKDFVSIISLSFGGILVLFSGLLFLLNRQISNKLWRPFYRNIEQINSFSMTQDTDLVLEESTIDEFQTLKFSIEELGRKLQKEYLVLKEFTENASHEIQTPLSIISLNLDAVLQGNHAESDMKHLFACYQAVQRISKLNEKLLFLAKLDNKQFDKVERVDFEALILSKKEELNAFLEQQKIEFHFEKTADFSHKMDASLANSLISNLFTNAIKHNVNGGKIKINMDSTQINIENTTSETIDVSTVFQRFVKGGNQPNSTGLGLSIVHKIVDNAGLKVRADLQNSIFKIEISKK